MVYIAIAYIPGVLNVYTDVCSYLSYKIRRAFSRAIQGRALV